MTIINWLDPDNLTKPAIRASIHAFICANDAQGLVDWIEINAERFDRYSLKELPSLTRAASRRSESTESPSVFVSSMPKSASTTLTKTIVEAFGHLETEIAVQMSVEENPLVLPRSVKNFAAGGFVTHSHVAAEAELIDQIVAAGLRNAVVQVRHPHDILISWTKHLQWTYFKYNQRARYDEDLTFLIKPFSDKVLYYAERIFEPVCRIPLTWANQGKVAPTFVSYQQVTNDPAATLGHLARELDLPWRNQTVNGQSAKRRHRADGVLPEEEKVRAILEERYPVPAELLDLLEDLR